MGVVNFYTQYIEYQDRFMAVAKTKDNIERKMIFNWPWQGVVSTIYHISPALSSWSPLLETVLPIWVLGP